MLTHPAPAAAVFFAAHQVRLLPGVVGGNELQATCSVTLAVPGAQVQLWQPLGLLPHGSRPALYDVAVTFTPSSSNSDGSCRSSRSSSVVRRVGFRTIELVRQPVAAAAAELLPHESQRRRQQQQQAADGESFYLRVNGVPLYAKGANLIPLHVLSTAVAPGALTGLLQDAADAHFNMIRVWGGGLYQVGGRLQRPAGQQQQQRAGAMCACMRRPWRMHARWC